MIQRLHATARYRIGRLRGFLLRIIITLCGGSCGRGLWVGRSVVWKYAPHSGIHLGHTVYIGEFSVIDVPPGGRLELGDHTKFTLGCVLAAQGAVTIGDHTLVGEYCSIRDADHGMSLSGLMCDQPMVCQPVSIGKNVWIGRGVAVLKGASIGSGSVIGANATVLAYPIPNNAICVGSPHRVVGERT